ncbi:zinc finger CCHC domain-containing protein 3 [Elgaria multicarinata webbii]|uniref:zinc finger CCHC domain-containing protein 3 n=1 Tax=Elgaria multicarinata webbii TaxID=159646 RepID=UPI002FCD0BC5
MAGGGRGGVGESVKSKGSMTTGLSYASVAGKVGEVLQRAARNGAAGWRQRQGVDEQEREDEEGLLGRVLEDFPDGVSEDPWRRYVIRFRYLRGNDEGRDTRDYLASELLVRTLGLSPDDVVALIQLPGSQETDVCLASEGAYRRFWAECRVLRRLRPELLEGFNILPLFRGDTKVLTIAFRTSAIPEGDVALWLSRYANILMGPEKKRDRHGFWTGKYRCVVAFKDVSHRGLSHKAGGGPSTGPESGAHSALDGRLPKYFYLGAERGITRYSGQPPACFQCGSYGLRRRSCMTPLCSRCRVHGHPTAACQQAIRCNLCEELGHTYYWCPMA